MRRSNGSILVGLLWCLALLAIVVLGILHTARLDLLVGKNYGDRMQAHYLALAGIEKTKALLYQDSRERRRSAQSHSGELFDAPQHFRDVKFGRGEFWVFRRGRQDEGGGTVYGVTDEESRLNLNTATADDLSKLYGMTPDVSAAIMDWKDADNTVSPNGAEVEYYTSLQPPYLPRNGPFQTVRELLMVRGVTRQLLFGRDTHFNGRFDPSGGDENDMSSLDEAGVLDAGWAGFLTVESLVRNVNAAGETRVDAQTADETSLSAVKGITADIAKAIVSYRNQNKLESLADLLDVTAGNGNNNGNNNNNNGRNGQNQNQPNGGGNNGGGGGGAKVISQTLLMDIGDDVNVKSEEDLPGLVNINTASLTVLVCLPGVSQELARAIIAYRQSSGFFSNTAHLLKVPGMSQDMFKQMAPRVTARSETYRIFCEGKVSSTGTRQRIQAVVRVGQSTIDTISYREDDL